MIFHYLEQNISENLNIVNNDLGTSDFIAVTGNEKDRSYWQEHFETVRGELFKQDNNSARR
jgi:hypothetical protein